MHERVPAGLEHVRTAPVFDRDTGPRGLLPTHRIASGVWARFIVRSGSLYFRLEARTDDPRIEPPGEGDRS